tara:strand:- start:25 stop:915 length:891 start_codon:yes stop_codon:yes gene_type:complete
MKYVVTGGAGFIGSNLVDKLLSEDHQVIILDNLATGNIDNLSKQASESFIHKDIAMALPQELNRICEDADGIFHMAAIPSVQFSVEKPVSTINANLISTVKMLEVAKKHSIKFVYSGSSSCYGDANKSPTNENETIKPLSPYALNKYQGEEYCKLYSNIYNINTICLRYFNVYGCRMTYTGAYRSVLSVFLQAYYDKKPFNIINDGTQTRDFIHVSDVARANICAMNTDIKAEMPFNIGSGENYSVNDIADMFGAEKIYGEKRTEPKNSLANISRAKLLLKWKPVIKLTEWIKEQL